MNKKRREDYEHTNSTGGASLSMSHIKDQSSRVPASPLVGFSGIPTPIRAVSQNRMTDLEKEEETANSFRGGKKGSYRLNHSTGKTWMRPSLSGFNKSTKSAERELENLEDDGSMKSNEGVRVGIILLFHYRISHRILEFEGFQEIDLKGKQFAASPGVLTGRFVCRTFA